MKNRIKKWICLLFVLCCSTSILSGCKKNPEEKLGVSTEKVISLSEPTYTDSEKRLNMYAFYSATDGYKKGALTGLRSGDGVDMRTIENYRMYKEAGFNTILLENECAYKGEEFATSDLKMVMDIAQELSLQVIVFDKRISSLCNTAEGIIGADKKFADEASLKKTIESYIAPYRNHPAFYGLYLMDEPTYAKMKAVSQITKAILDTDENIYVHCCLLPAITDIEMLGGTSSENKLDAYRRYLEGWFESGIKYMIYDDYMFLLKDEVETTNSFWMACMDVVAETAKKYNATFATTIQSFSMYFDEWGTGYRPVTEEDFRWQAYYALGHGATNLSYYYYWSDPYGNEEDSTCFLDEYGDKVMYDAGQRVNEEINRLAPVILSYDYLGAQYFTDQGRIPSYYSSIVKYSSKLFSVSEDISGDLMVCEMKEKEGEHYGYMLLNSADPFEKREVTTTIDFKGYRNAKVYIGGVESTQKLENGQFTVALEPGEGIFVIPY